MQTEGYEGSQLLQAGVGGKEVFTGTGASIIGRGSGTLA